MKKPREMLVSMSVVVDLPIERFDLAGWLPRLAAEDYVACTHIGHAHRWWNVYRRDDGKRVFRADDAMGPLRTTSFFVEDISRRLQLSLISTETRATWQGWPGRSVITTTWDMRVQPVDEARSRFTCTMGWRLHWLDRIGSRMLGLRAFADNRIEEATPHLADSAVRWSSRRVAEAASASIRRPEMRTEPESALARY